MSYTGNRGRRIRRTELLLAYKGSSKSVWATLDPIAKPGLLWGLHQGVNKAGSNQGEVHCQCTVKLSKFLFLFSRKDLVRVEATVIEKTESWPKINMKFRKRKNFRKKNSKCKTVCCGPVPLAHGGCCL